MPFLVFKPRFCVIPRPTPGNDFFQTFEYCVRISVILFCVQVIGRHLNTALHHSMLCILTSKHKALINCQKITFFILHTRGSSRKTKKKVCGSVIGSDSQKLVNTQKGAIPCLGTSMSRTRKS